MTSRVQKITDEIEQLKRKILNYQSRLRELERQKTELENADIIAAVRGVNVPPDEFMEFVRAFEAQRGRAVPDLASRRNPDRGEVTLIDD